MVETSGGGSGSKARLDMAKKSADFITTILAESGKAACSYAAREMERSGKQTELAVIQGDMCDCAAKVHAKTFVESNAHSTFLQESRKMGRVGTVVVNPSTNELIDTRAYGNTRARHRANNNRLEGATKMKPPPLYPAGSKKVQRMDEPLFATAVTPQRKSAYPPLKSAQSVEVVECCLSEEDEEDIIIVGNRVDDMLYRVTRRAFDQTGVFQSVINVESGQVEKISNEKISLYKNICSKREIARDVISKTLERREVSSSIECLKIVKPFIDDYN